jgi:drug/metabolite transporter (DMT)-like permease
VGELAALAAAALWAFASLGFRTLGTVTGARALNLGKCCYALLLLLTTHVLVAMAGGRWFPEASGSSWLLLIASGVIGLAIGDSAYFAALIRLGPRRTLLLWTLSPVLTALLAAMLLNESLHPRQAVGGILVLGGVIGVIGRHGGSGVAGLPWGGVLWGVMAACCQAIANITSRAAGAGWSGLEVSIVRLAAGSLVLVLWVPMRMQVALWQQVACDRQRRWLFIGACTTGTCLGIWLSMVAVLHAASVGVAATLLATSPLFVLPLVAFIDREPIAISDVLWVVVALAGVELLVLENI